MCEVKRRELCRKIPERGRGGEEHVLGGRAHFRSGSVISVGCTGDRWMPRGRLELRR